MRAFSLHMFVDFPETRILNVGAFSIISAVTVVQWVITLDSTSVITQGRQSDSAVHQSFCQSNHTHARARNRIGCSSTLSSVIGRRRAPTGTNRPFRSRFGAVLDARVILNAGGLHFPILLSSPTNSPHRTPGTAFLSRTARGSITQGIFCNPQLAVVI